MKEDKIQEALSEVIADAQAKIIHSLVKTILEKPETSTFYCSVSKTLQEIVDHTIGLDAFIDSIGECVNICVRKYVTEFDEKPICPSDTLCIDYTWLQVEGDDMDSDILQVHISREE